MIMVNTAMMPMMGIIVPKAATSIVILFYLHL
jgi:hypothetical protein